VAHSAGLLLWRRTPELEVLLAHPGGPLHAHKDVWGIPKGLVEPGEDLLETAYREFSEELGLPVPPGTPVPIGDIRQKGGKLVTGWALEGDLDPATIRPGHFEMVWPPRSGRVQSFPEIDRVAWFALREAEVRILPAQAPFLERLAGLPGAAPGPA
jgi:predicted NUDIX family NTP pyrophosphohydrolase